MVRGVPGPNLWSLLWRWGEWNGVEAGSMKSSPTAGMEFGGIPAQVHEASYRFLFFWLLSAKMGTKIVRVATLSIYNP